MPAPRFEEYFSAPVPADVDRADTVMFGLTGRQLLILAATGLGLWAGWALIGHAAPAVYLIAAVPLAGLTFVIAVGRRDGQPLDLWLRHALRHHRRPHRLVPADAPIAPPPDWVATVGPHQPLPAPLRLPARGISGDGVIDLAAEGSTVLVDASTLNVALRSAGEQTALIGGFARWLHTLDGPVQILLRAHRIDLHQMAHRIADAAPSLPHPALEAAARAHVAFLAQVAAERELLHRQVTIALRDTRSPAHAIHRATDTIRALGACEVTARPQDGNQVAATLATCLHGGHPAPTEPTAAGRTHP